jgi:quercetin dioxygenase-like cupin family protein/DNA-binding XRE family transcriptional regulator
MAQRLRQHLVGEHVRRARLQMGMTLRMLARQAGFSPSFMSQVENGQVSPSISSMEKIASAVGLTLGEFFAGVTGGEGGLIVRVADRQALSSQWSDAEIEVLSAPRARFEVLLITLRPGGRSGKHPYAHSSEEFAFVVQGELRLTLGPDEHRLRRGDAATILAGELRLWRNSTRAPARILIVTSTAGAPIARGRGPRGARVGLPLPETRGSSRSVRRSAR